MSAAVQERLMVRMAGVARPSAAQYSDTLGAWADAYQEAGGGLLPPRRVEPVFADPDGNPMVVRQGWDGPTAFPFPGTVPSPAADPAAPGFVGAAGGGGYAAAAQANFARRAAGNGEGDRPDGGEPPDDGGVFGDLKRQVSGYLAKMPAQFAQSLLKSALTNAILGGGSGGLSQLLSGGLGALVPGLGGAAGTLGSVLGGLADGTGTLGGVVGSLTGGCFAAGPAGIAFDPSVALSQLGGQLLNQWQVEDSDSMGEQLAHHTVNKYADQMQDPQAALDKLNGYFTGAAAVALFAAVRLTDADGVGDPVLAGATTVLVEGLPQARVGDPVLVPGVAVYMGAATVLTEGRMSARAGTTVSQAGPFSKGAATVFLNGPPGGTPPPPKPPPAPPKPPGNTSQQHSGQAAHGETGKPTKPKGKADSTDHSEGNKTDVESGPNQTPVPDEKSPLEKVLAGEAIEPDNMCKVPESPNDIVNKDGQFTPEEHRSRNQFNECPAEEPGVGAKDGTEWWKKTPDDCHRPLSCYEGSPGDGRIGDGSFECCYNKDGTLNDNTVQSGTFNFHNSRDNKLGHTGKDYLPHQNYGYGDKYDHVNSTLNAPLPPWYCQPGFGGLVPEL